jgi:hypothetical protein
MALKMYAIGYKYQEDVFFNFATGEDSFSLDPSCFLPTEEMAEQIIEDELSDQYGVVEIEILSVRNGVWSWARGDFETWDWEPEDEDE